MKSLFSRMSVVTAASSPSRSPSSKRYDWLDTFRGLAVVVMIEAHVFNSFALPHFFESSWFPILSFLNGLVAPTFLWIAGFLAGPSALKIRSIGDLQVRLRRCLEIFALGALMHAPWWLWLEGNFSEASWKIFFHQNILQCMGLSLGILSFLGYLLRNRSTKYLGWTFALLMLLVVGATPHISSLWENHPWVSLMVTEKTGSLFPILPWIAFAFAGALSSMKLWALPSWGRLLVGGVMILAGLESMPDEFSKAHPSFFVERLGYLIVLASLLEMLRVSWLPRGLKWAGKHSLGFYFWHLAALYFLPVGGTTLLARWGEKLDLKEVALLYLGIVAFCALMVWAQSKLKHRLIPEK